MSTTTVATPAPEPEQQASLSPISRVFGIFFSPGATFADIVRKPSWLVPIAIGTILSIVAVVAMNQRMDWREYIRQQMDRNQRSAQLSAEQKDQQAEVGAKVTTVIVYVAGVLTPVLFSLIVGVVMMGAYNLFAGAGARFEQAFSIVAHAGLVGIVSTPIFLLVLFLKPPGTIDPENPVATNIAALLPEDTAKWLFALCKSVDVFVIWTLVLIAIGFAAVNPRKLKGGKAFTIAFSVWAVYVLCRVGWAFAFS